MKSINSFIYFLVLGFSALILTACAKQTEPAKRALDEVHNIVREATVDGTRYVPDQMASVQKELGELQSSYDQKDYAVLDHAPAVLTDAKALAADATTRKGEFAKALDTEWRGFAAFLPQWITTVKDRVYELSKPNPVLSGIDLGVAKSGLANATDGWRRAQAAIASGEVGRRQCED